MADSRINPNKAPVPLVAASGLYKLLTEDGNESPS